MADDIARCAVCGTDQVTYRNYLGQPFCAPCADGRPSETRCTLCGHPMGDGAHGITTRHFGAVHVDVAVCDRLTATYGPGILPVPDATPVPAPAGRPRPRWATPGEYYPCTPKCGYVWRFTGTGWLLVAPEIAAEETPHDVFKWAEADCWAHIRRTYGDHHHG